MKHGILKLGILSLVLGMTLSASAKSKVVVPGILVTAHGGQFKGDIVADKIVDKGKTLEFSGLRLETKHGDYLLTNGGNVSVESVVCNFAAPKGWNRVSFPKSSSAIEDVEAVYFMKDGSARVNQFNHVEAYGARDTVWCSIEDLSWIVGE